MFISRSLSIALALTAFSQTSWAGQVTLKSTSSSVELVGEFKGYSNGIYTITSDLGELEVDARTVTCSGDACPEIKSLTSEFIISGNQLLINRLLLPLLESYSFSLDAKLEIDAGSDTKSNIMVTSRDGQKFANISLQPKAGTELQSSFVVKSGTAGVLSKGADMATVIPLAADALIAINSDTNPVKSISLDALQGVLGGSITNWKDLGGPDVSINVYLPQADSDLAKIAKAMGYDISKVTATERFEDLSTLSKVTTNDPYGLGFTNFTNRGAASTLPILGSCGANLRPSSFNISAGSYPATFYHYIETDTATLPIFASEFLNYLEGEQAKSMINHQGYPSLAVFESSLENQGNRIVHGLLSNTTSVPSLDFRAMLKALKTARQLSTVFRFNTDGVTLDPQSKAGFDALISGLFLGNFADQKIIIAGFTGAAGSNSDNKRKSKAQAALVSDLIKAADSDGLLADLQTEVLGFGETSPIACEDTAYGIAINNRVEIWVNGAF